MAEVARARTSRQAFVNWDKLHIELPDFSPPTPEELARRHEVVSKTLRLRDRMKPLGISFDELLCQVREEDTS